MPRVGFNHQPPDAFSRLPTDREDQTDWTDALPALTIFPANIAKEAEEIDEKFHIMSEPLNAIASGLSTVSKIAITLFTEFTTASLLAEQSNNPICCQLSSTVGTQGSENSLNFNGFPIHVAPIDRAIQEILP